MAERDSPYHAHVYYADGQRPVAEALREAFLGFAAGGGEPRVLFVGQMADTGVGPHPIPQFEVHFLGHSLAAMIATIEASGLRALVHPLTDDDLADHTSLAHWIGDAVALDLATLDPPGANQGVARFGKSDF